jgi:hypothetical protein
MLVTLWATGKFASGCNLMFIMRNVIHVEVKNGNGQRIRDNQKIGCDETAYEVSITERNGGRMA